jgi:formylglycine-generating enzyme required for sulfatase activity
MLLDFRLAREIQPGDLHQRTVSLCGTPGFLSLEQIDQEELDHRTDWIGLGCRLYQVTTGQLPFDPRKYGEYVLALNANAPAPLQTWNGEVPDWLARLIHRLLDKDRDRRPPSAAAVLHELETGGPKPIKITAEFPDPPTVPRPFVSRAAGTKFVPIPAGSYWRGSPIGEPGRYEAVETQHKVKLTRPFFLATVPVTKGQFRALVAATDYRQSARQDAHGWTARGVASHSRFHWDEVGFDQTDDHPVVCVSWADATAYAAWLSQQDGRAYRLPTEAEWEFACRAGTTTPYFFGDDPEQLALYGNVADAAARRYIPGLTAIRADDGYVFTAPVGKFRPNGYGLLDMHGNVSEWCADWYGPYFAHPLTDPTGPAASLFRVFRGGSWISSPRNARSAHRDGLHPATRNCNIGFRLAAGKA